tara:strand:+ start:425 stop:685 length:261 start_codon:yes stop_codon:yes gene_type:complete
MLNPCGMNEVGLVNELDENSQEIVDAMQKHYKKIRRQQEAEVIRRAYQSPHILKVVEELVGEVDAKYTKERLITPEETKFIFNELA